MPHQCAISEQPILFRDGFAPGAAAASGLRSDELASGQVARAIIKARAARRQVFDGQLFADPAWDMLLELYALRCEGVRVSVSKLSCAAGVPGTTGLRWIDKLESESLIVRESDPLDGRRVWVGLSEQGCEAMHLFLEQIPMRAIAGSVRR